MADRHYSFPARWAAQVLWTILIILASSAGAQAAPFLSGLRTVLTIASTVPANGDVNPYGIAVVHASVGALQRGSVLVSNFNDSSNLQGTGTTIVQIDVKGNVSLFATIDAAALEPACPGGVGLTTALAVLHRGWVIVGSLPDPTGLPADARTGCLIVLNAWGEAVTTIRGGGIRGPWDMAALDEDASATLFVSNVLVGDVTSGSPHVVNEGTVLRIDLQVPKQGEGLPERVCSTVVGSGFAETANASALVIGPTGLALAKDGTLYVADSLNNRIAAIPEATSRAASARTGTTVSEGGALNGPLGLTLAPNGDIVTVNGNDGNAVETTPAGVQVAVMTLDSVTGAGALFGLTVGPDAQALWFVDDGDNTLKAAIP